MGAPLWNTSAMQIGDGSERAVVIAAFQPSRPEGGVASVEVDSQPQVGAAFLPRLCEVCEALMGCKREPDRLKLVVVGRDRILEKDHQPIAGEVLERTAMIRNQAAERVVILAKHIELTVEQSSDPDPGPGRWRRRCSISGRPAHQNSW
jgi:hypothetical protein